MFKITEKESLKRVKGSKVAKGKPLEEKFRVQCFEIDIHFKNSVTKYSMQ